MPKTMKSRRSKKPRVSKKSIQKVVKKVLRSQEEIKVANNTATGINIYNSQYSSWTPNNVIQLSPSGTDLIINQGVGQGDRIGNHIRTRKLIFTGCIYAVPNAVVTLPVQEIVMYFVYFKQSTNGDPTTALQTSFFQSGDSSTGFNGSLQDIFREVNKDAFIYYKRRTFKIGNAIPAVVAGTPVYSGTNNDFKLNQKFKIDLTKYCPRQFHFNDSASAPTNQKSVWLVISSVNADNTANATANTNAVFDYEINYHYTDV